MAIKNLGKVVPQKGVDYFTEEDIISLNIPKKTSELKNDSGFITDYTESDPSVPSHVKAITQADIDNWNSKTSEGGSGLTTEQINALNEMFKVCAYIKEDVNTEYGAFKTAFGIDGESGETETTKTLQSISATYTGGNVVVGTNVNALTGITVKANYSDGTSTNVTDYTLSGTIAEGSNIITVTYQGLTTTFAVTGVAEETGGGETTKTLQSISATYTGGNVTVGTSVNSLTGVTVKANYSDGSQENVTGYTLSGNIVEGNNTITVSYEGLTTTFIVVGIAESTGGETTEVNLMTTGELGTFSDLGVYTGYDGYYNADAKTLQLTPKEAGTNKNAHLKLTPFVEIGKTYTLFAGPENRSSSSLKVDYSKDGKFAINYLSNNFISTVIDGTTIPIGVQFTVPDDAVEVFMMYFTKERIDTTATNVALYEGLYEEMP